MLLGGWRALRQYDLKLLLAYGTVSQLGFLHRGRSAPAPAPRRWPAWRCCSPTRCSRRRCSWSSASSTTPPAPATCASSRGLGRSRRRCSRWSPRSPARRWPASRRCSGSSPRRRVARRALVTATARRGAGVDGAGRRGARLGRSPSPTRLRSSGAPSPTKPGVAPTAVAPARTRPFAAPRRRCSAVAGLVGRVLAAAGRPRCSRRTPTTSRRRARATTSRCGTGRARAGCSALVLVGGALLCSAGARPLGRVQQRVLPVDGRPAPTGGPCAGWTALAVEVTGVTQRGSLPVYLGVILLCRRCCPARRCARRSWPARRGRAVGHAGAAGRSAVIIVVAAARVTARAGAGSTAVCWSASPATARRCCSSCTARPTWRSPRSWWRRSRWWCSCWCCAGCRTYFADRAAPVASWRMRARRGRGRRAGRRSSRGRRDRAQRHAGLGGLPEAAVDFGGGKNIVNVTLVDIRAWDTMGEISVLVVGRDRRGQPDLPGTRARHAAAVADRRPATRSPPTADDRVWLRGGAHCSPRRPVDRLRGGHPAALPRPSWCSRSTCSSPATTPPAAASRPGWSPAGPGRALPRRRPVRARRGGAGRRRPADGRGPVRRRRHRRWSPLLARRRTCCRARWSTCTCPLLGDVHFVTSLFFDIGVYLIVVGLVLDCCAASARELDRQIRRERADGRRPRGGAGVTPTSLVVIAGALFACGVYLLLERSLTRVLLGLAAARQRREPAVPDRRRPRRRAADRRADQRRRRR